MSPNLELNPFRSLPYITVQLPSAIVSNNVNRRASKEASLPSLFHMYTKDISLPMSNSSSTLNFRRLPSSSSKHLLPSNATATAAAATNGCYSTDKQTSTTAVPAFSAASFDYLCYSSVVTVVERLYFLSLPHASEWVEDEEQHTDWAVSSFFLSHAPGLSPMSVPIPAIDRLSMGLKSNHPNATGAGTGAHNIAQAHFDASEVGSMSDKESSIRTGCNNYSDIVFPMEQSISSASTRTPVYPLSLTLPREFERNDGLLNRGLYLNRRSEENSNPRLNRDSNRDYTNSEGSMTTMTVSPVKGSNPVSTLPLSLRSNKTQNNQFPSPVPSSSPLISAYGKTLGVTSLGPALSPSPSWRLREREKDRGARTGTGGISGLIRMQSMGTTGQSHSHGHVGVGGHNNNSQSTGHLLGHLNPGTAGGGMDVRAMIGEAKRRSDQRLNTDHQYLHRMAYACVRVGPNGFVWLSNNTGKVSDLNLSAERENLNLKKQKEFRSFCDSVSICYEVVLDIVEHSLLLVAERNIDESIKSSTCVSNIGVSRGLEEENAVRGTEEISKRDQAQTNALASILDFPVSEGDVVQLHTPISILPTAGAGAGTGVYTTPSAGSKAIVSYVLEGEGAVSADRTGLSHGESFGLRSNGQVIQGNDSLDSDPHHGLILSDLKSSLTHQKCDELDGINIGTERVDEGIRKDRDQFESYNYSNSCSPSPLTPETSIIESPSP